MRHIAVLFGLCLGLLLSLSRAGLAACQDDRALLYEALGQRLTVEQRAILIKANNRSTVPMKQSDDASCDRILSRALAEARLSVADVPLERRTPSKLDPLRAAAVSALALVEQRDMLAARSHADLLQTNWQQVSWSLQFDHPREWKYLDQAMVQVMSKLRNDPTNQPASWASLTNLLDRIDQVE